MTTRFPASATARARPALSVSTSDGLVPQVDLAAERNCWGAGPLGPTDSGRMAVVGAEVVTAPAKRAAMPTIVARAAVGPPSLGSASPKANTLPEADTCQ